MFGSTSAHGINAPADNVLTLTVADVSSATPASRTWYAGCIGACWRAGSPWARDDDAAVVTTAAQFWALIHGFVMLELAGLLRR